ncbi:DUF4172 domain-containing protein [Achromobacter sp. MY14]|uniref:DUF4172 domain-containing protein n=1 Tax=unclassified Achromobacter TaxID=2626865 RepID=UPI00351D61C1
MRSSEPLAAAANSLDNRRMNCGDYLYIWQAPDWPNWRYDLAVLAEPLAQVSRVMTQQNLLRLSG